MRRLEEALIIDTDIGTDVDDAIAVMYAIKAGANVKLISTVHGDATVRARIAKKLTMLLGVDIPVAAGESKPLKQKQLYLYGDEGKGFVDNNEGYQVRTDGVEAIAETIYGNRNAVAIASIGPMTNIAKAFQKHPDLAAMVSHIYVMGNAILRPTEYIINYRAHNFKVDPEAVDIVFATATPKTIVTTEVCKKASLSKADFEQVRQKRTPATDYIYAAAMAWMQKIEHDQAHLYDPLVIHQAIESDATTLLRYGNVAVTIDAKPGFSGHVLKTLLE